MLGFIQNFNGWEIPVIIFVILLLFGGKKLPELARGAGKAIREFKSATTEAEQTFKQAMEDEEPEKKPAETKATETKTAASPEPAEGSKA